MSPNLSPHLPRVLLLAFLAFGIANLAPSVTPGDAGEFTAAAATLSLPHPPSYPAYGLLGRAAGELIPFGNWAYRTNLFSLLAAAAALALLWDTAARAGLGAGGRLFACLLLASGPVFLYHAFVTEVFTLNLAFGAASLWLLSLGLPPARLAAAGGLLLGLASGNHQTIVLSLPALAFGLYEACRERRAAFVPALLRAAGGFTAGFLVYLYLPLRAAQSPPLDWGHPVTWDAAWHIILRRDYGSLALTVGEKAARTLSGELWQGWRYLAAMAGELGWPGVLLAAGGAAAWTAPRPSRAALVLFWFFTGPFFLMLGDPPVTPELEGALPRFYLLSLAPAALLAGRAFDGLLARNRAAWVLLALPAWLLWRGAPAWQTRWDLLAWDYGRAVLKSLPPGAVFFMDGGDDTFYSLAFLHAAEGRRPDVRIHDRGGVVYRHPYGEGFRKLDRQRKEERRREVEASLARERPLVYSTMNPQILPGHALLDVGLVQRAAPPDALVRPYSLWPFYVLRGRRALEERHYRYRALAPYFHYARARTDASAGAERDAGLRYALAAESGGDAVWLPGNLEYALSSQGFAAVERKDWAAAERWYRRQTRVLPRSHSGWLNLGVALERLGRLEEAERAERRAAELGPQDPNVFHSLGALYWRAERWKEAAEAFRRYNALRPDDPQGAAWLKRAEEKAR